VLRRIPLLANTCKFVPVHVVNDTVGQWKCTSTHINRGTSVLLHASATLSPRRSLPIPITQEAGRAPEPIRTLYLVGNRIKIPRFTSL